MVAGDAGARQPPSRIVNRYTVLEKLGEGGMGAVYRARDRLTSQYVAIKRIRVTTPDLPGATTVITSAAMQLAATQPAGAAPLLFALAREFRTLASMRHPHVISVLDYGFEGSREPFFTMELLSGARPLSDAIAGATREQRIRLLLQILQALTYVHRRGVLHRDLKPANVLVLGGGDDACIKVLDFGIACLRDQASQSALAGTVAYMAPELFGGEAPSAATDLWAVGVMAHEAMLGVHPIAARGAAEIMDAHLGAEPIFSEDARLPPELASVLRRALARSPGDRYPDAASFAHDLARAAGLPSPAETAEIRESFLSAAAFIGRAPELAALLAALDEARAGRGSIWLVGGESGVGKSRLLDELRTHALVGGTRVVRGQAVDAGGAAYQVWRAALRALCLAEELDDLDAGVLRIAVPDIDALLERRVPNPPEIDVEGALTRFLLTVEELLLAQRAPLVLLLEDLQWAEPASLALLRHLSRTAPRAPLLVIGSYRDDERADLPAELPVARRLPLRRFSAGEIASLGASMLGDAGRRADVVTFLERETEGNAFFVVEVVRALAQEAGALAWIGADGVPARIVAGGVRAVLGRQLGRVPAEARPLLHAAAVHGRELDLAVLRTLQGDPGRVDADLAACVSASVVEVSEDRWRFTHDKLREALLEELAVDERVAWHRRIGDAIERAHPGELDAQAAVLAYHFEQAGDLEREAAHRVRAGEHLLRGGAAIDAVSHLERADLLLDRIACTPEMRARALGLLSRAYHAVYRPEACIKTLERLLAKAGFPPPRSPLALAANIARGAARHALFRAWPKMHRPRGHSGEAAYVQELGAVLAVTAEDLSLTRSSWRIVGIALDFTAAAERLRDPLALAAAYAALGFLFSGSPSSRLCDDYLRRARSLLADAPTDRLNARAHMEMLQASVHLQRGQWTEAVARFEEEIRLRRRMGDRRAEMLALWQGLHAELHRGDMRGVLEYVGEMEELERRMDHTAYWMVPMLKSMLAMRRGALDEAAQMIAEANEFFAAAKAHAGHPAVDGLAALCALRRGDADEARRHADATLERLLATPPMVSQFLDVVSAMAEVYTALWSKAADGARATELESLVAKALSVLRSFGLRMPMGRPRALLWYGRWAAMRGRAMRARWYLRKAVESAKRYRMPFDEALALQALAEVEDARSERAHAVQHRRRAHELFEQLGASWHAAEVSARRS
jgi:eukaryotic-like serine/threonine-protein kinase